MKHPPRTVGSPWQRTLVAAALAMAFGATAGQTAGDAGGEPPAAGYGASLPAGSGARGTVSEFSVRAQATLTNNSSYGNVGGEGDVDLVLELVPTWRFHRQGARLRVDGSVALDMIGYVANTQVSRILPRANVLANLEAIDDLFFVDGTINVTQGLQNPFLPTTGASTNNLYTATQASVAPYLKGNLGRNVRWLVRSDNSYTWTTQSSTPLQDAYHMRNLAEVVRVPTPFGLTLRLTNEVTSYQNQLQPDQKLNTALAIVDYAVTPRFRVGLRGGYETTTYTSAEDSGPIYGANLTWQPSPRTVLDGFWESRFYGPSYQYRFSHRLRRLASSISGYRTISTYPQVLFNLPATNNVAGLLDAIFLARFPDPIERARQVEDLIVRQGLPDVLPQGAFVYNQSINLNTGATLAWALTGVRNTLGLNLFYLKTEQLPDARVPTTFINFNDNVQRGGSVTFSHRLNPVASLNATVTTRRPRGINENEGRESQQHAVSTQLNWQMTSRSTVFAGARFQIQDESGAVRFGSDRNEASLFAGLFHRL
jgi:uncharacterized protein (PEP-CTERM system associated)